MILAVCLNPAIDVTARPDGDVVATRGGGKAVNVARVLHTLGYRVRLVGFVAGANGSVLRDDLTGAGVDHECVEARGDTRHTYTTWRSDGTAVTVAGPGLTVTPAGWRRMQRLIGTIGAPVAVLSGSLPPGLPVDAYASITRSLTARGARVVLDTSGEALRLGLGAAPEVVAPNRSELAGLAGGAIDTVPDAVAAAVELRGRGAKTVVATLGEDGLVGLSPLGAWHVRPRHRTGNPTGAGDACVAGLAAALLDRRPWPAALQLAAALGALAVDQEVAGSVDPGELTTELDLTSVVAL